ncbi:hypothetical protein ABW19_dt0208256 [Dactylella cylindrospora]|nr:hypothetical protein ABW19_dt0208256 [Dactylella cylindrospora]
MANISLKSIRISGPGNPEIFKKFTHEKDSAVKPSFRGDYTLNRPGDYPVNISETRNYLYNDDGTAGSSDGKNIFLSPLVVPLNTTNPVFMEITIGTDSVGQVDGVQLSASCVGNENSGIEVLFNKPAQGDAGTSQYTASIPLNNQQNLFGVCAGFSGKVAMGLKSASGDLIGQFATVSLELYWVQSALPEGFRTGIPIQLLRMLLGTENMFTVMDENRWKKTVAGVMFGSIEPCTLKEKPANDESDMDHWLRYNFANGAYNFMYTGKNNDVPGRVCLLQWLDTYRTWRDNGRKYYATVNCYDQGNFSELFLSLGIDYKRICLESWQPFGFINERLVGWGMVNSPYFGGDLSKRVIKPVDSDEFPPDRTQFRNHVYTVVFEKERPELRKYHDKRVFNQYDDRYVIDACGGPWGGDKKHSDYQMSVDPAIIPSPIPHGQGWSDEYIWYTKSDREAWNQTENTTDLTQIYGNYFKGTGISFEDIQKQVASTAGVYQGSIKDLILLFQGRFKGSGYNFQAVKPRGLSDHYIDIEHRIWSDDGDPYASFITLKFMVASNTDLVLDRLWHNLAFLTMPETIGAKRLTLKQDIGTDGVYVLESTYLKTFVIRNVLVELRHLPGKAFKSELFESIEKGILNKMVEDDHGSSGKEWDGCLEGLDDIEPMRST